MRNTLLLSSFLSFSLVISFSPNAAGQSRNSQLSNLPALAQAPVSAALGQDIASYHARVSKTGVEVENASQKLSAEFTQRGVAIRNGEADFQLALKGYGHGSDIQLVQKVEPVSERNRVEYRRGPLTEWYVNGPVGLEQGFTINERGKTAGEPLTLVLGVAGNLRATEESRQGVLLAKADGTGVLRYSGLTAYDAAGKTLEAWQEISDSQLLLKVNDQNATYPIVVDPWVQLAKMTADVPQEAAELSYSVAVSGNTVVVGAPFDTINDVFPQGAVYVFVQPSGGWANMTQTAKLTASDGGLGDVLGVSVAISGNTVVAGAAGQNIGSNQAQGSAYVFVQPQSGWTDMTETAKLTSSDGQTYDFFGSSVAINGGTIAVGADGATVASNAYQGAVYIYAEPSGGWSTTSTYTAKLTTSDGIAGDQFGYSVGLSGNTLAVGARSATLGSNFMQGASYVFVEPTGGWQSASTATAKLSAADGAAGDWFGSSVAISNNNTVVSGAPLAANGKAAQQGAIYVFVQPNTGWQTGTQTAKLVNSGGNAGDELGFSSTISSDGKTIVGGAPGTAAGTVYIYNQPTKGWVNNSQSGKMKALDGSRGTWLGFGVAIASGTVFGGSPCATVTSGGPRPPVIYGANQCQGALYVFSN